MSLIITNPSNICNRSRETPVMLLMVVYINQGCHGIQELVQVHYPTSMYNYEVCFISKEIDFFSPSISLCLP